MAWIVAIDPAAGPDKLTIPPVNPDQVMAFGVKNPRRESLLTSMPIRSKEGERSSI